MDLHEIFCDFNFLSQDGKTEDIFSECQAKHRASADDMVNIKRGEIPTTPEAKCTMTCILKRSGMVSQMMTRLLVKCGLIPNSKLGHRKGWKASIGGQKCC